jgi:chaperonin GroES
MTTLRPLGDRVVVKPVEAETRSAGGIIIPDTVQEKPMRGRVVAAGPGGRTGAGKLTPMGVKPGDTVLCSKWSGTDVKVDGHELLVVKESDVLGVID